MAAFSPAQDQQQKAISAAAQAYSVPEWILVGFYGLSGYNPNQTYAQAFSAEQSTARALQHAYLSTGSWEKAIQTFTGGQHTLAQVQAQATSPATTAAFGGATGGNLGWVLGLAGAEIAAGVGAIAGAAGSAGEAAAGAAGAASAGEAGASAGAGSAGSAASTAGSAAGTASKIAGAASKAVSGAKALTGAAAGLSLAGLFTNVSWWKGAGMIVAGAIAILLAVREFVK